MASIEIRILREKTTISRKMIIKKRSSLCRWSFFDLDLKSLNSAIDMFKRCFFIPYCQKITKIKLIYDIKYISMY